jgi:prevent-host-death family protein
MEAPVREMTVREANQNFSQVIAAAEAGETIIIKKNGTPVARIVPQPKDPMSDPAWAAAHAALMESLNRPRIGIVVGTITEADLYDDDK